MDFGSRIIESKEYSSVALRENYNSNNISKYSTPTQIVDELRKKYDTPTRRELKDLQSKSIADKSQIHQDLQLKRSINSVPLGQVSGRDKWNASSRNYDMSPMYKKENMGEEETIFRKIKEMKDSLLNKNQKIKTTKSIYEPRISEKVEPRLNDNRVENIDKINSKIQQILSCLKDNEGKTSTFDQSDYKTDMKGSSKVTVDNSSKSYCMTKASQETKPYQYNQDLKASLDNKMEVKNTSSIYQEEKKYKMESPAPKKIESFELSSNRDNSKVRSFISSIQRETGVNNKYEMKSGKKLDDQISKIQLKIQQFEDEKRKLNIQFKPYSYSNSKSTANLTRRSYTIDKLQKPGLKAEITKPVENSKRTEDYAYTRKTGGYQKYSQKSYEDKYNVRMSYHAPSKEKSLDVTPIQVQIAKKYEKYERPAAIEKEKQVQKQEVSLFKLKLMPVQGEPKTFNSRLETKLLSEDFRKKTDEGILDRKKKLSTESSNRLRPTIKRIVEKLSQQANLDERLRNNKLYFESNMETNKWQTLDEQLKKNGMILDRQKLHRVFKITDEENNPFFSVRESQSNIQTLARSYVECQQHWNREIYKVFRREDLGNQQFSAGCLDLEKKGYIVVQDIVRFLNMETGTFYRNRDLFLIFRRISQQQKITFDQLLGTFCK